jgi:hypothetical protein
MLSTVPATFAAAEAACNTAGGHLTSLASFQEQQDLEQHWVSSGALIPEGHGAYWIGLMATNASNNATSWPSFRWLDNAVPVPVEKVWGHWAEGQPDRGTGQGEICALANYTLSYGYTWGWQDAACSTVAPFVCKLAGRQRSTCILNE